MITDYKCPHCKDYLFKWHDGSLVCSTCNISFNRERQPTPVYKIDKWIEDMDLQDITDEEKEVYDKILESNIQDAKEKNK